MSTDEKIEACIVNLSKIDEYVGRGEEYWDLEESNDVLQIISDTLDILYKEIGHLDIAESVAIAADQGILMWEQAFNILETAMWSGKGPSNLEIPNQLARWLREGEDANRVILAIKFSFFNISLEEMEVLFPKLALKFPELDSIIYSKLLCARQQLGVERK